MPPVQTGLEIQRQRGLGEPEDVAVTVTRIRPGPPPEGTVRATPTDTTSIPFAYGSPAQNSRLPAALPKGEWAIHWMSPVSQDFPPSFVLRDDRRILTEGGGECILFNIDGKRLAAHRTGPSPAFMDSKAGMYYVARDADHLRVGSLDDGEQRFLMTMAFGAPFARPLVFRAGKRVYVGGYETQRFSHKPVKANTALMEYQEIGQPLKIEGELLTSIARQETLLIGARMLMAAAHGDTIHLAIPSHLIAADLDFNVNSIGREGFEPKFFSVDEQSTRYLVVMSGSQLELWAVNAEGLKTLIFPIPDEMQSVASPPIIGWDHRIYLLSSAMLAALNQAGEMLWQRPVMGKAAGAGVTTDDQILVAAGSRLLAFAPDGESRTLFEFPGDTLRTPPVLTASGDILVASANRLYSLRVVRK